VGSGAATGAELVVVTGAVFDVATGAGLDVATFVFVDFRLTGGGLGMAGEDPDTGDEGPPASCPSFTNSKKMR
jgi:hypothetical protein